MTNTPPVSTHYDVIVAGGGSAGVAAAVAARRTGARVLLIERGPCLGGAATLRNVVTYAGLFVQDTFERVVFGVAEEIITGLSARGGIAKPQKFNAITMVFDPETLKVVLDELCERAGVEVRLHSMLTSASSKVGQVHAVDVHDHNGLHTFTARSFVDATGDADLAHHAGATVRYGHGGKVQNGSLGVRFGGVPSSVDVSVATFRAAIQQAKAAGETGLLAESGLVARMPVSNDIIVYTIDEGYDARSAVETSRAERGARAQAQAYLKALHRVPGAEEAYIVTTGPELGTRESRHISTRAKLSQDDILHPASPTGAVAIGAWPMEYHPGPGQPATWMFVGAPGYFPILLDHIWSIDRENLWAAGRTLDGDQHAGASVRVMGTALATGQAAGVAAGLQALARPISSETVRAQLQAQDARLPERPQPFAAPDAPGGPLPVRFSSL